VQAVFTDMRVETKKNKAGE